MPRYIIRKLNASHVNNFSKSVDIGMHDDMQITCVGAIYH